MARRAPVPRDRFRRVPVRDAEVEGGADRQVHDRHAGGLLLGFFEHDDRGVAVFCGEAGDLPHAEFVAVAVRGPPDVF